MTSDNTIRRTIHRLIIENRNSLNDPTTNEPYDMVGIADDFIALYRTNLEELLRSMPERLVGVRYSATINESEAYMDGYNEALSDCTALIKQAITELEKR